MEKLESPTGCVRAGCGRVGGCAWTDAVHDDGPEPVSSPNAAHPSPACGKLGPAGPLRIEVSFVNITEGHRYGDFVEAAGETSFARVFAALRREYGGHVARVFVDAAGGPRHVGWTFTRRVAYDRGRDTYVRQTWVTFFRDAVCPCCGSVAGRWRVTTDEARRFLAESVAA